MIISDNAKKLLVFIFAPTTVYAYRLFRYELRYVHAEVLQLAHHR